MQCPVRLLQLPFPVRGALVRRPVSGALPDRSHGVARGDRCPASQLGHGCGCGTPWCSIGVMRRSIGTPRDSMPENRPLSGAPSTRTSAPEACHAGQAPSPLASIARRAGTFALSEHCTPGRHLRLSEQSGMPGRMSRSSIPCRQPWRELRQPREGHAAPAARAARQPCGRLQHVRWHPSDARTT